MRVVVMLGLLAACGGPQAAPASDADCPTVAEHLVVLAERDNGAPATNGAEWVAELERACRDDGWSAERRVCLAAAQDQEATLDCPLE